MKAHFKTVAYFSSVLALLSATLTYMNTVSMGFPDGHLTEFERAAKPLFMSYSILALFLGFLFYACARLSSKTYSRTLFYFGLVFFILLLIGLAVLYFNFSSNLEHGGGG